MKRIKHRDRERGAQLLELALALPVLLLLAVIIIEFASVVRIHQVLNNAAREGARLSSLQENKCLTPSCSSNTAIQDTVLDYLCRNGVANQNCSGPSANVTVNQDVPVPGTGGIIMTTSLVTVSISYSLPLISAVQGSSTVQGITLQGRAQFRRLY